MHLGLFPVYRDDRVIIKGLDCQRTAALGIGGAKLAAPLFRKNGLATADLVHIHRQCWFFDVSEELRADDLIFTEVDFFFTCHRHLRRPNCIRQQAHVFDGQHTIEIIASESGSRDTPVWCMIYDDLKYKEEAHIFADQQKHVKALSSFETFKAHIEADDPKQKMIEAIVQSYGLAITSTKAKNGISAVSTLERIYDKYGQAVLDRTLRLAAATWEGENNSFSGNILMGIARIVVAYGDTVRDDVFKDHVGRVSVKAIIRAAKERRPGALGYSEAMIIEYNKKSKFRLSLKTLYGGKPMSGEDDFGEE